ncbi:toxin-antitoxin system YwqK family antitoxin [Pedobacter caeni]|uniref:Antitoxin component YwqK of the YwqJK toxin-antitoxin module n=1 Tax=Pedobacter caeni TaxID=288992 RepID=A0A1M4VJQ8_9SPHI|nr:toxin-antitoxin system YwqK family antitoxin [Pedobacter caeni]SHE69120.1 Antitoxin component YwqK of the YwqJK toxin-antitoxin module [Pedobacter caeni]
MKTNQNLIVKLSYTLIFLCLSGSLFAQLPEVVKWNHLVKTYNADSTEMLLSLNNNPLQGQYEIALDEGGFALYNIKNGLITGEAFWYAQDGRMECKLHFKNGVRNGLKENYDNQGKVWLRQEYKDGRQHGVSEMYQGDKIVNKSNYKAGKKDGPSFTYSDGQVTTEGNYENNLRNGVFRVYSRGEIVTENNYKDDLQNGLSTMYAMGKKNMDSMYENGKRHGVSHMYKPDGSVLFESYFLLGDKVTKDVFEKYQQSNKK